jgi:hypothetical protein
MISALSVAPRDTRFRTKASSVVFFLFSKTPLTPSKAHALRHDVVFFPHCPNIFVLP